MHKIIPPPTAKTAEATAGAGLWNKKGWGPLAYIKFAFKILQIIMYNLGAGTSKLCLLPLQL